MKALAGEVFFIFSDKDHAPVGLGGRERGGEKEGAQDAAAAVSKYRAAIALFGYKTKTANPIRAFYILEEKFSRI